VLLRGQTQKRNLKEVIVDAPAEEKDKAVATKTSAPKPAPTPVVNADLSDQIERTIEREPRDQVRCVRVFDDYYRCNWWHRPASSPQSDNWAALINDRIRKSRFLRATLQAGSLVIDESPAQNVKISEDQKN
jgi:hypothetical protein